LCRTTAGKLITVYRESDGHSAYEFTDLVMRHSTDDGQTWSDKQVLIRSRREGDALMKYNCPRIQQLDDGRLCVLCDVFQQPPGEGSARDSRIMWWLSSDEGVSYSGPVDSGVRGIMPDKILQTSRGTWLIATHWRGEDGFLIQYVWRSEDRGETWGGPIVVCEQDGLNPCEASIIELPDGALVCYMRENSGTGLCGPKCLSFDDGQTWEGPYDTLMAGCHRPVSGYLPGGQIMVTYRNVPGGKSPWAKNFFAYKESVESARATQTGEQSGIILPLDHDRSPHSDSGYSGWVCLPDDSTYVVNYICDDAPMAQIRAYRFTEADF